MGSWVWGAQAHGHPHKLWVFAFVMAPKSIGFGEAHPARGTLIWTLARVDAVVMCELPSLAEATRAEHTTEGPMAGMDVAMTPQVAGPLEGLAAIFAHMWLQL